MKILSSIVKTALRRHLFHTTALPLLFTAVLTTGCSDFVNVDSGRVIPADKEHLNEAEDTLYSVVGIINKMQTIADRTILLGEMRADLVDINSTTSADLRDMATFNMGEDNAYNAPSDYYAVINNCNYFLAHADTALRNSRNERIFHKEYAAVKAYRAWTYMQLAMNYGSVPFITTPILTKAESDKEYERKDMQAICTYFLDDLKGLETVEMPGYGEIRNTDSRFFYFPVYLLEGDMNLWLGRYREAAQCYYRYLSSRNGTNSAYPLGSGNDSWMMEDTHWLMRSTDWSGRLGNENYGSTGELITMLPGDSIPSEGNYSMLRNLFNSTNDNGGRPSIVPSQGLIDLSAVQTYCHQLTNGDIIYAPKGLERNTSGDLRLAGVWQTRTTVNPLTSEKTDVQQIGKYDSRNIHLYRRTTVYLRLAEALNRAGFPRFAMAILKTGVNDEVIARDVLPYYPEDRAWLSTFSFPDNLYVLRTDARQSSENTIGIHSHGSGWSEHNEHYVLPDDSTLAATERLDYQVRGVEDLIMDEEALELAFEGYRFYDLMRVALRRGDPAYLADRVYGRRGKSRMAEMKALIRKDLYQPENWYMKLK